MYIFMERQGQGQKVKYKFTLAWVLYELTFCFVSKSLLCMEIFLMMQFHENQENSFPLFDLKKMNLGQHVYKTFFVAPSAKRGNTLV